MDESIYNGTVAQGAPTVGAHRPDVDIALRQRRGVALDQSLHGRPAVACPAAIQVEDGAAVGPQAAGALLDDQQRAGDLCGAPWVGGVAHAGAGVVDDEFGRAEGSFRHVEQRLHLIGLAQVGRHGNGQATRAPDGGHRARHAGMAGRIAQDDSRALGGQRPGGAGARLVGGAGHQHAAGEHSLHVGLRIEEWRQCVARAPRSVILILRVSCTILQSSGRALFRPRGIRQDGNHPSVCPYGSFLSCSQRIITAR